jgi:alpha-tubulin suppressor-like RCC1 family protein
MSMAGDKIEVRTIASHTDIIMVRTMLGKACFIRAGGKLECGSAYSAGRGDPPIEGVLSVAPGSGHTCILMTDRTVRCWGDNTFGAVGKATVNRSPTPREVLAPAAP